MTTLLPYALPLDPANFRSVAGIQTSTRRLSDMRGYFQDQAAEATLIVSADPVIYVFLALNYAGEGIGLNHGITTIYPGKVGNEYFMTKGHFHQGDEDEIYVTTSGQGLLLLQTRSGEAKKLEMLPGQLCYVPTGWAHRTVNTGSVPLNFLSLWSSSATYDYGSIAESGFPQIVIESAQGVSVIDSPSFMHDQSR